MKTENHALDQAVAQCESIVEMVAAMECDYGRLEDLREELKDTERACSSVEHGFDSARNHAGNELSAWHDENGEELAELESAAGDCESEDDARERIQEDPLSIEVRSDWHAPGESGEPTEFCILLCTGGPAVRIVGDLDRGEPSRPRVEYQDWGTPWTEYFPTREQLDALQSYVSCFYFGE